MVLLKSNIGVLIKVEKFIDPLYGTCIADLQEFNPEIVFICVPTPMSNDGSQDSTIIESVVKELVELCPNSIKIVKSTVLPSVLEKLEKIEPSLVYNPEFLREKNANLDFVNSDMIIFGGNRNTCSKVSDAYLKYSRCKTKEHIFANLKTASLVKYSINTFWLQRLFFLMSFLIFERLNVFDSWESLVDIISRDKRIGDSHMNVPGHDGSV